MNRERPRRLVRRQQTQCGEAGEGQGYRYAVINLGAKTREGLLSKARDVERALGGRLVPLRA